MKSPSPTLHLICGLPGSGKSTLALELERQSQMFRFSPDAWLARMGFDGNDEKARQMVEHLQWELAQKLLAAGQDVILEFGFWSRAERERFRNTARDLGAKTQLHYLDVSIDELKRRIEKRNANLPSESFYVNPLTLDEWVKAFETPLAEEFAGE